MENKSKNKEEEVYGNEGFVPDQNGHAQQHHATGNGVNGDAVIDVTTRHADVIAVTKDKQLEELDVEENVKEEDDPWALPELKDSDEPWSTLTSSQRVRRVVWNVVRFVGLLLLLYLFICSLDVLSSAFRLLGGKAAGEALSNTVLFSNPIAGMMLGVLATVLVQSSSTSTSIVVSMVSAGLLPVYSAIPMMMGANVGTTVTNTLVAVGQSTSRGCFRRAFAAATVHDIFNWLSILAFLPLEAATRYLYHLTSLCVSNLGDGQSQVEGDNPEFLKAITKPFTDTIVQLSTDKIREIAKGNDVNGTLLTGDDHLFAGWTGSDEAAGGILLGASLLVLCAVLVLIVKLLASVLKGTVARLLQRFINSDLPGCAKHLTGYLAILVGAGLTILVQSSSIFTSALTPLAGIGAIHIDRMYPLTLGSNIGTTVTSILAALASDSTGFKNSIQVALSHLFFNLSGILLWYPVPFLRRVPVSLAKKMGETVSEYRWVAGVYLVFLYFLFPVIVFGLSLAGWEIMLGVLLPVCLLLVVVIIVNILQTKRPRLLPKKLRSWEELGVPRPLRSLDPYDRVFLRMRQHATCGCCKSKTSPLQEELKKDEETGRTAKLVAVHELKNGLEKT